MISKYLLLLYVSIKIAFEYLPIKNCQFADESTWMY